MRACAVEINPFLQWFGRAKLRFYSPADAARTIQLGARILDLMARGEAPPAPPPPIRNIHRWWDDEPLAFLRTLFAAFNRVAPDSRDPARDLLLVAFCRVMIGMSKAAFNHQSVSFRESDPARLFAAPEAKAAANEFRRDLHRVADEAVRDNPAAPARLVGGDSRHLDKLLNEKFDLLITSPPYANRMSYIRELRPHMYWLGYLRGVGRSRRPGLAGHWRHLGGGHQPTGRMASVHAGSHPIEKNRRDRFRRIRQKRRADGQLHLEVFPRRPRAFDFRVFRVESGRGSALHYWQFHFYGVNLPTEEIYADLMEQAGFRQVEIRVIRKRNSKKGLREYDVIARRP